MVNYFDKERLKKPVLIFIIIKYVILSPDCFSKGETKHFIYSFIPVSWFVFEESDAHLFAFLS